MDVVDVVVRVKWGKLLYSLVEIITKRQVTTYILLLCEP